MSLSRSLVFCPAALSMSLAACGEVSFDGTQTASLTIDGKASFKLDLATGDLTGA